MNDLKTLFIAVSCALSLTSTAVVPNNEIYRLGGNYFAYPYTNAPAPKLTAAPKGYEAFHIEHYGRHGSRWLIGKDAYSKSIELLLPAERNGKLTERGKELMEQLRFIEEKSRQRDGELTEVGAEQHRGIARRMYANFPEVFSKGARVDARSTVVIRCILSMDNELQELKSANPSLEITSDASAATMDYMNHHFVEGRGKGRRIGEVVGEWHKNHPVEYTFIDKIVSDKQFVKDSINVPYLFSQMTAITNNNQSHHGMPSLYDLFTEDELKLQWVNDATWWYFNNSNTDVTEHIMPYSQVQLLSNIIASADTALVSPRNSANLRFGHDSVVLPLAALMELDNAGKEYNDVESLLNSDWRLENIIPMAGNVQIIFYRPKKGGKSDDVLVKVLLNEKEVTLPVATDKAPYYRWNDVRTYYLNKINRFKDTVASQANEKK
jgi:hypothetical protein